VVTRASAASARPLHYAIGVFAVTIIAPTGAYMAWLEITQALLHEPTAKPVSPRRATAAAEPPSGYLNAAIATHTSKTRRILRSVTLPQKVGGVSILYQLPGNTAGSQQYDEPAAKDGFLRAASSNRVAARRAGAAERADGSALRRVRGHRFATALVARLALLGSLWKRPSNVETPTSFSQVAHVL
jgi:hypothetical protein